MDIDPKDYKYVARDTTGFNPKRNEAIIQETIQEADKYHASYGKLIDEGLAERYEVLSQYGDYRLNRSGQKSIKEFLGNKLYTELVGERLIEKVRVAQTVDKFGKKPILL